MKKIKLNKAKVALVDDEDYERLSQWEWKRHKGGNTFYAARWVSNKIIFMHREILNIEKNKDTDHINGDGLDNRKDNLRACSHQENMYNKQIYKNNLCGYKGVYKTLYSKIKPYRARIRVERKEISLGNHETVLGAARAYNEAATKYHGEFAKLNHI